jgi:hypothetical protein
MMVKTGVECEFFLISADGSAISDAARHRRKALLRPAGAPAALRRDRRDLRLHARTRLEPLPERPRGRERPVRDELGTSTTRCAPPTARLLQVHGEVGAEKHGLRATFMPKPFKGLTGNGCHAHISVWDKPRARPTLFDPTGDALRPFRKLGRNFLGGIMKHAAALAADHQPDGQHLQAHQRPAHRLGATWSPNTVTWTGNNRTHMVRVPGPGRFELRLPDGAANPYLLQAIIIAAGLSGIRARADPGRHHDIDMYRDGHTVTDAPRLPLNLLDALREFEKDAELTAMLGAEFSSAYLKLKRRPAASCTASPGAGRRSRLRACRGTPVPCAGRSGRRRISSSA